MRIVCSNAEVPSNFGSHLDPDLDWIFLGGGMPYALSECSVLNVLGSAEKRLVMKCNFLCDQVAAFGGIIVASYCCSVCSM